MLANQIGGYRQKKKSGQTLRLAMGITSGVTFTLAFICAIITLIVVLQPCCKDGDCDKEDSKKTTPTVTETHSIPKDIVISDDVKRVVNRTPSNGGHPFMTVSFATDAEKEAIVGQTVVSDAEKLDWCEYTCRQYNMLNPGKVSEEDLKNDRCFHWTFDSTDQKCYLYNVKKTEQEFRDSTLNDDSQINARYTTGFVGGNRGLVLSEDEQDTYLVGTNMIETSTKLFVNFGSASDVSSGSLQTKLSESTRFRDDFAKVLTGTQVHRIRKYIKGEDMTLSNVRRENVVLRDDIEITGITVTPASRDLTPCAIGSELHAACKSQGATCAQLSTAETCLDCSSCAAVKGEEFVGDDICDNRADVCEGESDAFAYPEKNKLKQTDEDVAEGIVIDKKNCFSGRQLSVLSKAFRGRKLQIKENMFEVTVQWRVIKDNKTIAESAQKMINGMFDCFDNCRYRETELLPADDSTKFGIVHVPSDDTTAGISAGNVASSTNDLGVKAMQEELHYALTEFAESTTIVKNVVQVYFMEQQANSPTAVLRTSVKIPSSEWVKHLQSRDLKTQHSQSFKDVDSIDACRVRCEKATDCHAWEYTYDSRIVDANVVSNCVPSDLCQTGAPTDANFAANTLARDQQKRSPSFCNTGSVQGVEGPQEGLVQSSRTGENTCNLYGEAKIVSERKLFKELTPNINRIVGMVKSQEFEIEKEEAKKEDKKKKSGTTTKCSTMNIIWITFLCLFLVFFFVSVICLIVLIWSKMNAKDENSYGAGSPYDQYGASPHSLEMQHRWLRHKAMVKNNDRKFEEGSERGSSSSRRSKKSKRSKSEGSSRKNSKNRSSDAPRNDVVLGQSQQQPQVVYLNGSQQAQPQMVGVPQQQPIRVVVRNQSQGNYQQQPTQVIYR